MRDNTESPGFVRIIYGLRQSPSTQSALGTYVRMYVFLVNFKICTDLVDLLRNSLLEIASYAAWKILHKTWNE